MIYRYSRHVSVWDEASNGRKLVEVDVAIDLDELAQDLARRTNRSKSGTSCMHGKTIVAKQREITDTTPLTTL